MNPIENTEPKEEEMSSKPSPFHDSRGVPICGGDLIRSYHFTDRRRKRHYLYHVAVLEAGRWHMVPTCWLDPSKVIDGGKCPMWQDHLLRIEARVISGFGPGDCLSFEDRPRVSVVEKVPTKEGR